MGSALAHTAGQSLDILSDRARDAGASQVSVDEARRATAVRFRLSGSDSAISARAEAYFWGVVRRRALRGGAPDLTASMLALSLATELTEAGHHPAVVWAEVARVYGSERARAITTAVQGGWAA